MASELGVMLHLTPEFRGHFQLLKTTQSYGAVMTFSADGHERAHEHGDHSACGADTECHRSWLGELAGAGEVSAIQDHTYERHFRCSPDWLCHQIWMRDQRREAEDRLRGQGSVQSAPLTAEGGGHVEAVVQHHMDGMVSQSILHEGGHPQILEVRKGDVLIVPAPASVNFGMTPESYQTLCELFEIEHIFEAPTLAAPFILRKAVDG